MSRVSIRRLFRALPVLEERVSWRIKRVFLAVAYPEVRLGANVRIPWTSQLRATGGGVIEIGDDVSIDPGTILHSKGGSLRIGARSSIGPGNIIVSIASIEIGEDTLIAEYVTIRDQDHEFERQGSIASSGMRVGAIKIGRNVWIGAKATITRGVSIGDNAVVGANAVVTHDVPAEAVVGGVPARMIRMQRQDLRVE
ncbi:acyltransferase [Methylocystis bryophila]|uniref:Acetyltransferase n=1 Tax=Methylocystis bryophila TaxID=655015 RepID=A0A1W6MQT3_9HYPH|nr:acyltransferase [Methylocystis bryophila]ARN79953.1 hypothetical protein B1812_01420 [Methylocystis bryophila]BDV39855.1 hypothetical protein DSM21852_31080 [Methylocystis bryophila]